MSVSPRQNFLKPPPVPDTPTVTLIAPFLAFWNSSATASVIGNTVPHPPPLGSFPPRGRGKKGPPGAPATAAATPSMVILRFRFINVISNISQGMGD